MISQRILLNGVLIALIFAFFPVTITYAAITEWTPLPPGDNTGIKFGDMRVSSVAYGNGRFVAVGFQGKASYSADGINWTALPAGDNTGIKFGTSGARSVTYGNGKFVVVGWDGKASYSADGISWTALPAGNNTGIKFGTSIASDVTYGDGKFVAVGWDGKASHSTDGINWTAYEGNTGLHAFSVAYGNGRFVMVGSDGNASYSTDGINWEFVQGGANSGLRFGTSNANSITYGNGKFVAVGDGGKASYSTDGIGWTPLPVGNNTGIRFGSNHATFVTYENETFIVLGWRGRASYSTDGINWTALPAGTNSGIKFGTTEILSDAHSAAYGKGTFVVVGGNGQASYSLPLHSHINRLFRQVFDRNPHADEWQYWLTRTKDRTTIAQLFDTMLYHRAAFGQSPRIEPEGENLIPQLNQIIRGNLGSRHVHSDMWHYYAERLTVPQNDPAHIRTLSRLRDVMAYWQSVQPDNPRGLTKAEHAARKAQSQPSEGFVSQLNRIAREVFGGNPNTSQWHYWANRIDIGEIVNAADLRNKMIYHLNFFTIHGRYP